MLTNSCTGTSIRMVTVTLRQKRCELRIWLPLNHDFKNSGNSNTGTVWTRLTHQNSVYWTTLSQSIANSASWITSAESPPYIIGSVTRWVIRRCIVRVPQQPFRLHFDSSTFRKFHTVLAGDSLYSMKLFIFNYRAMNTSLYQVDWTHASEFTVLNTLCTGEFFGEAWISSAESLP